MKMSVFGHLAHFLGNKVVKVLIIQGQIFILETAILATPYFQTFHYDGCTAGQKVKSGES